MSNKRWRLCLCRKTRVSRVHIRSRVDLLGFDYVQPDLCFITVSITPVNLTLSCCAASLHKTCESSKYNLLNDPVFNIHVWLKYVTLFCSKNFNLTFHISLEKTLVRFSLQNNFNSVCFRFSTGFLYNRIQDFPKHDIFFSCNCSSPCDLLGWCHICWSTSPGESNIGVEYSPFVHSLHNCGLVESKLVSLSILLSVNNSYSKVFWNLLCLSDDTLLQTCVVKIRLWWWRARFVFFK